MSGWATHLHTYAVLVLQCPSDLVPGFPNGQNQCSTSVQYHSVIREQHSTVCEACGHIAVYVAGVEGGAVPGECRGHRLGTSGPAHLVFMFITDWLLLALRRCTAWVPNTALPGRVTIRPSTALSGGLYFNGFRIVTFCRTLHILHWRICYI